MYMKSIFVYDVGIKVFIIIIGVGKLILSSLNYFFGCIKDVLMCLIMYVFLFNF